MNMNQRFFVTSTGTGIGKSFITAALVRQAKALGKSVVAYKPVISGFNPADAANSDTGLLLQSQDLPLTPENIARISPWRFAAPLAPSMAARLENCTVNFEDIVSHSRKVAAMAEDVVLIEGVGGVMVPLNDCHTILDWIEATEMQTLLVVGSYLGTISHTLTALAVLQQRAIPLHAVIINESEDSPLSLQDIVEELGHWTRLPIITVARRKTPDGWRDVKELHRVLG
jgi:dethiobiotin synthetase